MALKPRPLPTVLLVGLVPVACWFVARPLIDPIPPLPALYASLGMSILAFLVAVRLIPRLGPVFVAADLKGKDLLKTYNDPMYVAVFMDLCSSSMQRQPGEHGSRVRCSIHPIVDAFHPVRILIVYHGPCKWDRDI